MAVWSKSKHWALSPRSRPVVRNHQAFGSKPRNPESSSVAKESALPGMASGLCDSKRLPGTPSGEPSPGDRWQVDEPSGKAGFGTFG